jgi:hypothetical protein
MMALADRSRIARIHQRHEDRDEPGSVILGVMDKTALTTGPKPGPR